MDDREDDDDGGENSAYPANVVPDTRRDADSVKDKEHTGYLYHIRVVF